MSDGRHASASRYLSSRNPRRARLKFAVISVVVGVGSVVWAVFMPSVGSIAVSAFLVACLSFAWAGVFETQRISRTQAGGLVITKDSISSPLFRLPLERIERVELGYTTAGQLPALFIHPYSAADVRWSSAYFRLNARLARLTRQPTLQILDSAVDEPLEEVVRELEALAGRSLLERQTPAR